MAKFRNPKQKKDRSKLRGSVHSSAKHGGISIAIKGSNQSPINIQMSRRNPQEASTKPIAWESSFVKGSSCCLTTGIAGTLDALNGHHRECFSSDGTVILGTVDGPLMETIPSSRASWQIPIGPNFFNKFVRGFLAIGCLRYYGGLHSRRYESVATISVNGQPLDRILLRIIPEGHSDYFCRRPKPELWPNLSPIAECHTSYVWGLIRSHLADATSQSVEVDIDGYGNWDIDYVGLVFQRAH